MKFLLSKISDKALTFSKKIYFALALLFIFGILIDYFLNFLFGTPKKRTYDLAMKHRLTSQSLLMI